MRLAPIVPLLVAGCHPSGDDPARLSPRGEQGVTTPAPTAPPGARRVTARVVEHLAVGWAHTLRVELEGDLIGIGWLYVPAGDAAALRCALDDAQKPRPVLQLQLSPFTPPAAAADMPHTFQLRLPGDGGTSYWTVDACTTPPPAR
jgi:hypothetical protein